MSKMLKVIVINKGYAEYRSIEYDNSDMLLNELHNILGGYVEQVTFASDFVVLCNEDGRSMKLPYNCTIRGVDFVGPIIICSSDCEDWTDVKYTIGDIYRSLVFIGEKIK